MRRQPTPSQPSRYLLPMVLLLLLAGAEFLVRGPLRGDGSRDLASPYVSSYSLLHHANPYATANFVPIFWARGGTPQLYVNESGQHSIYPPFSIAVFSPFALLSLPHAITLYKALCTLLYLGLVVSLARCIGTRWRSPLRLGFLAFSLGLSAVQTGIHVANLSILSFALCGFAMLLAMEDDGIFPGILLALGACLKPTGAAAVVLLFLLYRRRASISLIVTSALTLAVTYAMMHGIDPAWKADYASNLAFMFSPSGAAAFTNPSLGHFDLLNLQVPLFEMVHNPLTANILAWLIGAVLFAWWLYAFRPLARNRRPLSWLAISSLCLIALLPTYQRNYNDAVLVFALLWAISNLRLPVARVIVILSAVFLTPGESLLKTSMHNPSVIHSLIWRAFIVPHATWMLLVIICLLLFQAQRERLPGATRLSEPAAS